MSCESRLTPKLFFAPGPHLRLSLMTIELLVCFVICVTTATKMREIKRNLELEEGSTYFEFDDQSHFMVGKSPELLRIIGKGIEDILKSPSM